MKSCGSERIRTTTEPLQGSVAFVGAGPNFPFTFDLLVNGNLVPLMIDTKKPYGEYAVRLVLMAYEKGLTLRVLRDLDHPNWAIVVFI